MISKSKLCPHSLIPNSGAPLLVKAGCPVIKAVDNMGLLLEAQQINPDITGIARFMSPNIEAQQLRHLDPKAAAIFWVDAYREKIRLNPHVKYIELPNEPVFKTTVNGQEMDDLLGLAWLGEFCRHCVLILASMGLRAVGPNFSTGYPAMASYEVLLPFLKQLRDSGGILGIHGYSVVPPAEDDNNTNRHEQIYSQVLLPNGLGDLPIVYTEWGRIDYRQHVTDEQYAQELMVADIRLQTFAGRLLGAAIFTFGSTNIAWDTYNVSDNVAKRLADYIALSSKPVGETPPVPTPPASTKFKRGDRVEITSDIGLRVRETPAGNIVGVQRFKAKALIVDGPVRASLGADSIVWWKVDNDINPDGWMSEAFLEKFVVPEPAPVPEVPPTNTEQLVFEENFTHGHYLQFGPENDNKWTPNGWVIWFAEEGTTPQIEGQDKTQTWTPPEILIDDINRVHISERDKYFKRPDGSMSPALLHLFRGWGRLWIKLFRNFSMMDGDYRLVVRYFPDVVLEQGVESDILVKHCDPNPINNEFKWIIGRAETPWLLGDTHPACQYNELSTTFHHNGGSIDLGFELRMRWGVLVTGTYVENVKLFRLEEK